MAACRRSQQSTVLHTRGTGLSAVAVSLSPLRVAEARRAGDASLVLGIIRDDGDCSAGAVIQDSAFVLRLAKKFELFGEAFKLIADSGCWLGSPEKHRNLLNMSKVRIVERILLMGQQAIGLCHRVNAVLAGYEEKLNSDGLKALQDSNVIRVLETWTKNLEKEPGYYPTLENLPPSLCEKVLPLIKDPAAAEKISSELEDLYTLCLDCMIVLNAASEYFSEISEPHGFLIVGAEGPMELCIEIVTSVSWICRLTILLSLFNQRVHVALLYAFTFQKCRGNSEAWFTDLVDFLQKLSKPMELLRNRLANGKGIIVDILNSFQSHNGLVAKVFDVLETMRIPELDLTRDSTVLQYPLASRSSEDLMICCRQSSQLSVAFAYCALIALENLIDDDAGFALIEMIVKSRAVLPLMDEHLFDLVGEVYGALADSADISWKAFQENLGKDKRNRRKEAIKAAIVELCQFSIPNHFRFRIFLKESIDRANWLLQDCGGVSAPQLPCLLALVGLAKSEIGWSFHHSDFKPQSRIEKLFKEHKFSASKAFDPEHMTWLYNCVITLKSNIEQMKRFITPYHVELARRYSEQFATVRARVPDDKIHVHMRIGHDLSAYIKHADIDLFGLKVDALRVMFLFSSGVKMKDVNVDESTQKQIIMAASGLYRCMELAELVSRLFDIANLSEFSHPHERFSKIVQEAMKVSGGIKSQNYNSAIGPLLTVPASWPVNSHEFLGPCHQDQVCIEAEDVFQHFIQLSCNAIMSCIKRVYDLRLQIGAHVSNIKAAHELGPARFVLPKPTKQDLIQLQSCIQSMAKSIDRVPPFVCGKKQVCAVAFLANSIYTETIQLVTKIFCPDGFDQKPSTPAACVTGMSCLISVIGDLRTSMRLEVWTVLRNAVCFNMFSSNFGTIGKPPPSPFPASPSEQDIILSYANFFIKTITDKASQVYWQPLSKCFNNKEGKHVFQDYTSSVALENLCSLIGPVGVRVVSQQILQATVDIVNQLEAKLKDNSKHIDELEKICSNQGSFQMASSALKSVNTGEICALLCTFGALLTLRSQILLGLNRVLTQRLNLIPTLVLDALCCSREFKTALFHSILNCIQARLNCFLQCRPMKCLLLRLIAALALRPVHFPVQKPLQLEKN